jgi:hypothetical protein
MSVLINPKKKIGFLGFPKTASLYMETLLNKYNEFTFKKFPKEIYDKNYFRQMIIDEGVSAFNLDDTYNDYIFFSITRNPYERFLSGFLFLKGKEFKIDNKKIKDKYICPPNMSRSSYTINFNLDGNTLLNEISLDEIIYNKDNLNQFQYIHLFMIQSDFLKNLNHKVEIIKLENLKKELPIILEKFNLVFMNLNDKDDNNPHQTIKLHEIDNYYTDNSLQFVNNYFSDDFTRFGYTKFSTMEEMAAYYN